MADESDRRTPLAKIAQREEELVGKLRVQVIREREAVKRLDAERARAMRTRVVLLGNAVILAACAVILLRAPIQSAFSLAAVAVLFLLAVATVFLAVLCSSGSREAAYRLDISRRELAAAERALEEYHSGTPVPPSDA